jgi:EAL domain-containing protein (putative c-di-GMP-specific phosphodiesterase class I)
VAWHRSIAGPPRRYLSVNLSARQLSQADLVERVSAALQESGLPPALLELEITESVLMQDLASSIQTLEQLRGLGVRLAIDDFGTGYSSLNYLRRLPVDTLKIDRSFIQEAERDPRSHSILRAIVAIAEALDLAVTAEGVETAAQLRRVRAVGCERIQGFYFSKAVDAESMTTLLRTGLRRDGHRQQRRAA